MLSLELHLRNYENALAQVAHPAGTIQIDSLRFEVNSYPATYVDDSIRSQSTFLIGEIRSYKQDWASIKSYYAGKQLETGEPGNLSVWAFPLELNSDGQKSWLEFPSDFPFDPFQADILDELQTTHLLERTLTGEHHLYLVYATVDP